VLIAVDFDGTIVSQAHPYADLETPLTFLPGAMEGLYALKAAGHKLVLWSGRSRLSIRRNDPTLDPLVLGGVKRNRPDKDAAINEARFQQMLRFVAEELPGVFDYIYQGGEIDKPGVDMFIDNIAVRLGGGQGVSWKQIAHMYGEVSYE
jgi:hypothetical protein